MSADPTVVVDGKKVTLYSFTGKVTSTKKDKEQVISSQTMGTGNNRQTAVTSTTIEHHEFFLANADGKEKSVQLVNFDFPLREGQTLSIVWGMPEDSELGPYIHARNHSTDEVSQINPNNIADYFKKPWWMVAGVAVGLMIVSYPILSFMCMFMILVSFFYFRYRSRKAAKGLLNSPELSRMDAELAKIAPL